MKKQFYRAEAVPNTYTAIVQRRSTLYPLQGWPRGSHRKPGEPQKQFVWRDTVRKSLEVQDLWHDRVLELADAGWRYARRGDSKAVRDIQSCRPTFFIPKGAVTKDRRATNKKFIRCQRPGCPHCYARSVADLWSRLDAALFPEDVVRNMDCDVSFRDRHVHILPDQEKWLSAHVESQLPVKLFKAAGVLGGIQQLVVEPHAEKGYNLKVRQIVIRTHDPGRATSGPDVDDRCVTRRQVAKKQPNRKEIMEATARLLRYPTLLLRGDATRAVRSLEAAYYKTPAGEEKRRRLTATFGCVYGQKKKPKGREGG